MLLLRLVSFISIVAAKCTITQTCLNPGNIPDYDKCIPEANVDALPLPMQGEGWPSVIGGGNCSTDADCSNKGVCSSTNQCVCDSDGISAGSHCEDIAIQCPEYQNRACCSWQQNRALAENFKLIGSLFGRNEKGGCDACAANMMRLWCGLICSPNQSDFMHLHSPSTTHRLDPLSGKTAKVLQVDVQLKRITACSVFGSCENTALVSTIAAMTRSEIGYNHSMYKSFPLWEVRYHTRSGNSK